MEDLAALVPEGIIRLHVTAPISARLDENEETRVKVPRLESTDTSQTDQTMESPPEAQDAPHTNPMAFMAMQFPPMWLPMASAHMQGEQPRSEFNKIGLEKREN